jgi:hypothetical protein
MKFVRKNKKTKLFSRIKFHSLKLEKGYGVGEQRIIHQKNQYTTLAPIRLVI